MKLTPTMLQMLFEIGEQRTQYSYHNRATLSALRRRDLILPPISCGHWAGALTDAGRAALAAVVKCRAKIVENGADHKVEYLCVLSPGHDGPHQRRQLPHQDSSNG